MAIYGGLRVNASVTSSESVTMAFKIDNGETDDMFQGDLIKLQAAGSVTKSPGDADVAVVGVFVGCNYTNSDGERVYTNKYNVDISRDDNIAFVNVNPHQLYTVLVGTGGTAGTIDQSSIGKSLDIDANAGNGTTGLSGMMAKTSTEQNTARVRIVGVTNDDGTDPNTEAAATTYTHAIVVIDPATAFFGSSVGI